MLEMELEKHLQVVLLRDQYRSNDFLFLTVNHAKSANGTRAPVIPPGGEAPSRWF
jgi:hypothetical protein